jgi:hypothetical protein
MLRAEGHVDIGSLRIFPTRLSVGLYLDFYSA